MLAPFGFQPRPFCGPLFQVGFGALGFLRALAQLLPELLDFVLRVRNRLRCYLLVGEPCEFGTVSMATRVVAKPFPEA